MNPILTGGGLAIYLVLVNTITWHRFFLDKQRAIEGADRISEVNLLSWAFIGGSLGAKWSQCRFRHKTRKQPFAMVLNMILLMHVTLVGMLILVGLYLSSAT